MKLTKSLIAGVLIIVFSTIGIDAVDHYDNFSESIAGRLFVGKVDGPCPNEMTLIQSADGNFCIDLYENSANKECPHQIPISSEQSKDNLNFHDCAPTSLPNSVPWTNITQDQAISACTKGGKRLATNKEWSQAALGTPDKNSSWDQNDCQVSKNWNLQPGLTGSGQNCFSSFGAYDMIGNVWEWVDGTIDNGTLDGDILPKEGYVAGINKQNGMPANTTNEAPIEYYNDYFWIKNTKIRAIARGGYWDNKDVAGQYSFYIVSEPNFSGLATGFRCVKSPKTSL